jgi:YVTN family beta-propeller protein
MLRSLHLIAALLLLAGSPAAAQWLETQIDLAAAARPVDLCFNPTDDKVYSANYGTDDVTIIDGATNAVLATVATGDQPTSLCYNSVNNRVYVLHTGTAQSISVLDGPSNSIVGTISVGPYAQDLCYNPENNKVYCSNMYGNSVSVIDGATNSVITTVTTGAGPGAVFYYAPTNRVYVANTVGFSVTVIDGATNAVLATIPANVPARFGCNPDNNKVYCVCTNRWLMYVFDGTSNAVLDSVTFSSQTAPWCVDYCPRNNTAYLAVKNGTYSKVMLIDGTTNALLDSIAVNPLPDLILYNRWTNKMLTFDDGPYTASVIDCATNTLVRTIPIDTSPDCAVWNPIDNRVYVGCYINIPYPPMMTSSICVIRDSGGAVTETPNAEVRTPDRGAAIVRTSLHLTSSLNPSIPSSLLDASGRRVLALRPGPNDVSRVAPGIYFVRRQDATTRVLVAK